MHLDAHFFVNERHVAIPSSPHTQTCSTSSSHRVQRDRTMGYDMPYKSSRNTTPAPNNHGLTHESTVFPYHTVSPIPILPCQFFSFLLKLAIFLNFSLFYKQTPLDKTVNTCYSAFSKKEEKCSCAEIWGGERNRSRHPLGRTARTDHWVRFDWEYSRSFLISIQACTVRFGEQSQATSRFKACFDREPSQILAQEHSLDPRMVSATERTHHDYRLSDCLTSRTHRDKQS